MLVIYGIKYHFNKLILVLSKKISNKNILFLNNWIRIIDKNKKGKSVMPTIHWKKNKNLIMQETLNSISLGPLWLEYLLFFVISYVNVVLQNLKYIFLIKSTKLKAAGIGMVTSIFYASVVVMIAKHELVSILIVAMTHFLGIYTARLISESLEKKGYLKKNE